MPLLADLCLAMRFDPLGMIRGLGEVVTCIYGPAVTYAFPDPLVADTRELNKCARRNSAELEQTGGVEGTDERHGALRESERSRADGIQLPGAVTVQNGGGGNVRVP